MVKTLIFLLLLLPIIINAALELPFDVDAAAVSEAVNSSSSPTSSAAQPYAAEATAPTSLIATAATAPTALVAMAASSSSTLATSAVKVYFSNPMTSLMTAAATALTAPAATKATLATTYAPLYTESASSAYAPPRLLSAAATPAGTSTAARYANTSGDRLKENSGDPAPLASTYSHPSSGNAGDLLADIDRMEDAVIDFTFPPRSMEQVMSEYPELDFVKAQLADCREMYEICRAKLNELRLRLQRRKREEEVESCVCCS